MIVPFTEGSAVSPAERVAGLHLERRHWLAIAIIVGAVLGAVVVGALSTTVGSRTAGAVAIFILAIAVAALLSVPAVAFVALVDRRERESPSLYAVAIGSGMLGATGLALALNTAAMRSVFDILADAQTGAVSVTGRAELTELATAILVVPPIEAVAMAIVLVALAFVLRGQFFTMRDGIVFGLLVGIGFNVIETPFAIMRGYAETGSAPWAPQLIGRFVFLGINGAALYAALLGAGIGYALQRGGLRGMLGLIGGTITSIAAHMSHNALTGLVLALVLVILGHDPGAAADATSFLASVPAPVYWLGIAVATVASQWWAYLLLGILLVRSARYDRRVIRHELEDELGISITQEDLDAVVSEHLFGSRRIAGLDRRTNRKLVDAQNRLAFSRTRARRHDRDPDTDPQVFACRAEIAWMRSATAPPPAGVVESAARTERLARQLAGIGSTGRSDTPFVAIAIGTATASRSARSRPALRSARRLIPIIWRWVMTNTPKPSSGIAALLPGLPAPNQPRVRSMSRVRPGPAGSSTIAQLTLNSWGIDDDIIPPDIASPGVSVFGIDAAVRFCQAWAISVSTYRTSASFGSTSLASKPPSGWVGTMSPTSRVWCSGRIASALVPFMSSRS